MVWDQHTWSIACSFMNQLNHCGHLLRLNGWQPGRGFSLLWQQNSGILSPRRFVYPLLLLSSASEWRIFRVFLAFPQWSLLPILCFNHCFYVFNVYNDEHWEVNCFKMWFYYICFKSLTTCGSGKDRKMEYKFCK